MSRVLPLSKPKKTREQMSSYRPINNLPCLEKNFEPHVLEKLLEFKKINNTLLLFHHGGRASHSTTTALADIQYRLIKNYDNNKISALLTTDLTAAYDTVDTSILLDKLELYGIRDDTLKLFKSYLTDTKQFLRL